MAATQAGALLTEAHRLAQVQVSAETIALLAKVWPLLDPTDIDGSLEQWLAVALTVVERQRGRSEAIARAYLDQFRAVEVPDAAPFTFPAGPPLNVEAASKALVIRGPYRFKELTTRLTLEAASDAASASSAAAGARHSLNGGRDLLQVAAEADPEAIRGRRVTSPGCCAFCAMLAARSFAGLSSDATASGMDTYKVHDHCHCTSELVYPNGTAVVEEQARGFADIYRTSQADRSGGYGGGGNPGLNAFRRALDAQRQGA